jgi:hypothetical protein
MSRDTERETPCYVISSNGFRESVMYVDDWCYSKSGYIGTSADDDKLREMIKADIRAHWPERNGIPLYFVSDHGNESRLRSIRLRRK